LLKRNRRNHKVARSTTDPRKQVALTGMAQKLYEMAGDRAGDFERVQQEFNDRQMLRSVQPQPTMQQQQQIQPKKKRIGRLSWRPLSFQNQV
jgi:hypothetical protein